MKKTINLAFTDFKLIFRDASLRAFTIFPVILLIVFVYLLPLLTSRYFVLTPYLVIILSMGVLSNTQMFNFISSMVLIDEKETEVAKIYGIIPLSKLQYLFSRFLLPYLITVITTFILLKVQPFFSISVINILLISLLNSMIVPLYVMTMAIMVNNRMQGMVYIKAFNLIILIPVIAFFVPENYIHIFGLFPSHWVFQSISYTVQERSIGWLVILGFLYYGFLLWVVSRHFFKKHFV